MKGVALNETKSLAKELKRVKQFLLLKIVKELKKARDGDIDNNARLVQELEEKLKQFKLVNHINLMSKIFLKEDMTIPEILAAQSTWKEFIIGNDNKESDVDVVFNDFEKQIIEKDSVKVLIDDIKQAFEKGLVKVDVTGKKRKRAEKETLSTRDGAEYQLICGLEGCRAKFRTEEDRSKHQNLRHENALSDGEMQDNRNSKNTRYDPDEIEDVGDFLVREKTKGFHKNRIGQRRRKLLQIQELKRQRENALRKGKKLPEFKRIEVPVSSRLKAIKLRKQPEKVVTEAGKSADKPKSERMEHGKFKINIKPSEADMHPSWAAKKKETEAVKLGFQGKKITFDD